MRSPVRYQSARRFQCREPGALLPELMTVVCMIWQHPPLHHAERRQLQSAAQAAAAWRC